MKFAAKAISDGCLCFCFRSYRWIFGSLSLWPRNYLKKFSMNCCTVHYFFIPLYVIVRKQQKLIVCILNLLKLKMVRWLIFKSR